jgi:formylglycine-generating enzyme required for sulfatase activity
MSTRTRLTRREFLRFASVAAPAVLLGACAPGLTRETAIPAPPTAAPPTGIPASPIVAAPTRILATPTAAPPAGSPATPTVAPSTAPMAAIVPEMVRVEAGSFEMGSADGYPDEQPVHTIAITRPFFMGRYEVTFEQYDRFCAEAAHARPDDEGFGRGRLPVMGVDWYDATAFCNWLSHRQGHSV